MGKIYEKLQNVAYEVKYLLEDIEDEGLQNKMITPINKSDLVDICGSIDYNWGSLDRDRLEQGMNGMCCSSLSELLELLEMYQIEMDGILN